MTFPDEVRQLREQLARIMLTDQPPFPQAGEMRRIVARLAQLTGKTEREVYDSSWRELVTLLVQRLPEEPRP